MADVTNDSGLREKIKDVLLDYCRQYADVRSCMVGSARASNTAMLLSDGTDRLLALISPDGEVGGWQPIETAKGGKTAVLVFGNRASWSGGYSIQTGDDLTRHLHEGATHWMPLPPAPRGMEG